MTVDFSVISLTLLNTFDAMNSVGVRGRDFMRSLLGFTSICSRMSIN